MGIASVWDFQALTQESRKEILPELIAILPHCYLNNPLLAVQIFSLVKQHRVLIHNNLYKYFENP